MKKLLWSIPLVALMAMPALAQTDAEPESSSTPPSEKEKVQIEKDLAELQGTWFREMRSGIFGKRRITKHIEGDRETITEYDEDGEVQDSYSVKVTLRRAGPIRVFMYSDWVVESGPDKGNKLENRGAYVYKVVDDKFVEIWGVLGEEDSEISVLRWQRVDGGAKHGSSDA